MLSDVRDKSGKDAHRCVGCGAIIPRNYKKARWMAIRAGTLFLPILGLPALISLRRLSLYNETFKINPHPNQG